MIGDVVAILAAFPIAYWVRFRSPLDALVPATKGTPPLAPYLVAGAVLTVVLVPLLASFGHYRIERIASRAEKAARIVRVATLGILTGAALSFFYREFSFSRTYFPVLYVVLSGLLIAARGAAGFASRRWRRGRPLQVLLVGSSPSGLVLAARMQRHDSTGIALVGRLAAATAPSGYAADRRTIGPALALREVAAGATASLEADLPLLGTYADVADVCERERIDIVILALPLAEQTHASDIVGALRGLPVEIELVPDILQLLSLRARVREIDGLPVLSLREIPLSGWRGVQKRAFDLFVATGAVVLLSPLLFVLALLVKTTSSGPVFYRQERLGRDGRRFQIMKYRSMPVGAEHASGPVWATRSDARPTGVGAVLRRWSLDELPQLFNVVRGEMSLVGPRPERPHFVNQFTSRMPDYVDRQRVKSGITGWAQVNGLRGDTSIEDRTRYDLYYVENWSLAFDVEILFRTIRAVLRREEAY